MGYGATFGILGGHGPLAPPLNPPMEQEKFAGQRPTFYHCAMQPTVAWLAFAYGRAMLARHEQRENIIPRCKLCYAQPVGA